MLGREREGILWFMGHHQGVLGIRFQTTHLCQSVEMTFMDTRTFEPKQRARDEK